MAPLHSRPGGSFLSQQDGVAWGSLYSPLPSPWQWQRQQAAGVARWSNGRASQAPAPSPPSLPAGHALAALFPTLFSPAASPMPPPPPPSFPAIVSSLSGRPKLPAPDSHAHRRHTIVPLLLPSEHGLPFAVSLELVHPTTPCTQGAHGHAGADAWGAAAHASAWGAAAHASTPLAGPYVGTAWGSDAMHATVPSPDLELHYVLSGEGAVLGADGDARPVRAGDSVLAWAHTTQLRAPLAASHATSSVERSEEEGEGGDSLGGEPLATLKFHIPAHLLRVPPVASGSDVGSSSSSSSDGAAGPGSKGRGRRAGPARGPGGGGLAAALPSAPLLPWQWLEAVLWRSSGASGASGGVMPRGGLATHLHVFSSHVAGGTPSAVAAGVQGCACDDGLRGPAAALTAAECERIMATAQVRAKSAVSALNSRAAASSSSSKAIRVSPGSSDGAGTDKAAGALAVQGQQQQQQRQWQHQQDQQQHQQQPQHMAGSRKGSCVLMQRAMEDFVVYRFPQQTNRLAFVFDPTELDIPLSFGVEVFEAGHRTPIHVHNIAHELFFVLAGSGDAYCDGHHTAVHAGDVIVFPPGSKHGLDNNTSEKLYCLQLMTPNEMFVEHVKTGTRIGRLDDEDLCNLTNTHC